MGDKTGIERAADLHHITRTNLPWRDATRTVCGKPISQYRPDLVITLADAQSMQRRLGQQRFALAICMTCANNVGHWAEWDANPIMRFQREINGNGMGRDRDDQVVENELRAVAALIERHREEFDDMVTALSDGSVITMQQLRRNRQTKEAGRG
ncbi:MAG: hypothetical protein Q7V57_11140 [Actinomycetota bacterium]|nr:hypothetical protein [Actinomycetota bacterium]